MIPWRTLGGFWGTSRHLGDKPGYPLGALWHYLHDFFDGRAAATGHRVPLSQTVSVHSAVNRYKAELLKFDCDYF